MTPATDTYVLLRAFVDELARCGMRLACTSPGSRCAPLVLTLARESRLECHSHVDERCAGFFALGAAKASGLPVAVACTSGTAAAELLPAAIEAREARVPLLLLTADRPPELRENGAGQAIDQQKIFGDAAKWFFEVGTHDADPARLRWIRTLACRAYWTALEGRPGAVHLNFPLREPLVTDEALPDDGTARPDWQPYVRRATTTSSMPAPVIVPVASPANSTDDLAALAEIVAGAKRGVLVAGRHERWPIRGCERSECLPDRSPLGRAAAAFCEALGWPLLADPLSGARRGAAAVAHYDALLREDAFADAHRPDFVLRVGDLPVAKPLRTWLAGLAGVRQVALDTEGAWQDPASVLSDSLALEPAAALAALTRAAAAAPTGAGSPRVEDDPPPLSPADSDWLASWRSADEQAAEAILGVLDGEQLDEPSIAAELGVLLPEEATLFVASSMPVRDIETFWPVREDPPRVLCNRGANGIDGIVSSAFGAAAVADEPVVLMIGDVALAHDLGGLLAAARLDLKLTIVLLDNDGGGIFDFLPVSRAAMARERGREPRPGGETDAGVGARERDDVYTRHVATPTGLDFARVAALYGLVHEPVHTIPDLRAALERALAPRTASTLIHARTDRGANVELHGRVWSAVSAASNDPTG